MRALIIEDDPSVSRSIELILKARGSTCTTAESGAAGLEAARDADHDIILLDLSLPDMDGHAVLQKLRAAHVRTPVLILSGSNDRQDKVKGLGIGADDYVTKPFDKDELLARIRAIIRRATWRTPPPTAAVLDGTLLAKRGQATAWGFAESYTPQDASPPTQLSNEAPRAEDHRQAAGASETIIDLGVLTPPGETSPNVPELGAVPDFGPARIIVLGNAKGGTGKSTIAMHLIVALLGEGHRIGSIDCDHPQGSLTRYIENRRRFTADKEPRLALPSHKVLGAETVTGDKADLMLGELAKRHDIIVIDTPGHNTPLARWAHSRADVLITPINDSFVDLDVLAEVAGNPCRVVGPSHYSELVAAARETRAASGRNGMAWIVLHNRLAHVEAQNRRRMAKILAELSGSLGFREGPGLRERVIYRELFLSGLTLLDLPRKDAHLKFSMSHVTARQELRQLLEAVQATLTVHGNAPAGPKAHVSTEGVVGP